MDKMFSLILVSISFLLIQITKISREKVWRPIFLKTWYLEDQYTNMFCQGAWFKMWEKWWEQLDLVWWKSWICGELVWFWTIKFITFQKMWFQNTYEANSYYIKLHNVFVYLSCIIILLKTALNDSFCVKMSKSGNTGVWGSENILYISP